MIYFSRELSRFIAAGRLHAKIDKVGGIVETNRPDSKNYQYQVIDFSFCSCYLNRNIKFDLMCLLRLCSLCLQNFIRFVATTIFANLD